MAEDDETGTVRASLERRGSLLTTFEVLVLIAIGGFAGSNLRYFASLVFPGLSGTLLVNVLGSFVLGFVLYESIYAGLLADQTHFVVGTGFLSSFTTYSTFAVQTVGTGDPVWMLVNVVTNYGLGFLGVFVGRELARRFDGVSAR